MCPGDLDSGPRATTENALLSCLLSYPAQIVFSNTVPLTCQVSWMLCLWHSWALVDSLPHSPFHLVACPGLKATALLHLYKVILAPGLPGASGRDDTVGRDRAPAGGRLV